MIYNRLYINIIIRVSFITLTCIGIAYSIFRFVDWLLALNLLAILALQLYFLVRSINRTNNDLELFFTALENNDMSFSFNEPVAHSHQKLLQRMNMIKEKINNLRRENEKQYHYFKAVVDNVGVGLMVCQKNGTIDLLNDAGRKILGIPRLTNLNQLDQYFDQLSDNLKSTSSGQHIMLRLSILNNLVPISFKVNDYVFFEQPVRLISFQNIKNELDEQELESWQKLIRVLTHEIMNSTGPITSSIDTILEFLIEEDSGELKKIENITQNTMQDIWQGISIIKERSLGLSEFVQNFRSLTMLPKITPTKFLVEDLFKHIPFLFAEEIHCKKIDLDITVLPKKLELTADSKLIEQVIINLIHNSIDAIANMEKKQIRLKAFLNSNDRIVCQVIDNGKGIPGDLIDTIFVPFFTTKANGSGIGLTLSREIMKLHGGSIKASSEPDRETIFTLEF